MSDTIHDVLARIGVSDLRTSSEGYECRCPICDSRRRSFRVAYEGKNGKAGAFFCQKCGENGSLVELLMRGYGMDRGRATELAGEFAPALRRRRRRREPERPGIEEIAPYRRNLSKWLVERGYDEEWIWRYRVGFDFFTGEVVYPTYDVAGDLVGITRRVAKDGQPSYHMGDFEKSNHLWGIDLAVRSRETAVYVVEGQTDTLGLAPVATSPVVNTFGSKMSPAQARILVRHFYTVILAYDDDPAGHYGIAAARRELRKQGVGEMFCALVPAEDAGELPGVEDPEIEHLTFREWKRHTNWSDHGNSRNISSKTYEGHRKVAAW